MNFVDIIRRHLRNQLNGRNITIYVHYTARSCSSNNFHKINSHGKSMYSIDLIFLIFNLRIAAIIFSEFFPYFWQIQKFNLEIALFVKELNSFIENVNEINDETIKFLTESILSINKLQVNSNFRETSAIQESCFVDNLNNDVFKCRRFIVCCLCHVSISFTKRIIEN